MNRNYFNMTSRKIVGCVKPDELSLFFHIIATSLYTFPPVLWGFGNSPSVKFHSSHPKTLTHCFLNCLCCLIMLSVQLILLKSEKMVFVGCQIRAIGGVWKNFPPHLCYCFRCEVSGMGVSVMQDDDVSSRHLSRNAPWSLCSVWT